MNSNALAWAKIVRALLDGDCRVHELVEATGLRRLTLYNYLRYLKKEGAVHIATKEADVNGRKLINVWRLGDGNDAIPRTQPRSVKNAKLRQKNLHARLSATVRVPS